MIQVSAPAGDFFLDEASRRPLVLLSGGVGLTPMVSMLEHLVGRGTPPETWYVHAALGGRQHAMKQHVRDLATANGPIHPVVFYEHPAPEDVLGRDYDLPGRVTMDWLKGAVPVADAHFTSVARAASCACSRSACAPWTCPTNVSTSNSSDRRKRCTPECRARDRTRQGKRPSSIEQDRLPTSLWRATPASTAAPCPVSSPCRAPGGSPFHPGRRRRSWLRCRPSVT